jgi:hypothetical protein
MRVREIFRYPKRDNLCFMRYRTSRLSPLVRGSNELLIVTGSYFHSFSMFAPLWKLGDRSLGTTTSGPRSARAACSSNAAFALNLISSKMRTSVAISQAVKQTISVRSGNDLRREIAATGAFGESPLPKIRLAVARSASVVPSIGMFIFMVEGTCGRQRAAISP